MSDCIEILRRYNAWRRGDETEMFEPKVIGHAIDEAIAELKHLRRIESAARGVVVTRDSDDPDLLLLQDRLARLDI